MLPKYMAKAGKIMEESIGKRTIPIQALCKHFDKYKLRLSGRL